jgi:hypothetical protein
MQIMAAIDPSDSSGLFQASANALNEKVIFKSVAVGRQTQKLFFSRTA